MRSSKFKDLDKNANNGSLFYQAFNNTSSIISYEPSSSSSRAGAGPQFSSAHLEVSGRKILAHSTAMTTKTTAKDDPMKQTGGLKRARADDVTDSTTAATSTTLSILDKPPIFDLYSLMKRTRNESTASSNLKQPVSSSLSSSISVISSETRRLLRELERRNSPITAAKRMKQDESDIKNIRPNITEHESSTRSSISRPPPTSSLLTPYRAHVLPRLATLGRSPYARPLKETADKAISVDMSQETVTSSTAASRQKEPGASSLKVGSKIKLPGGSRNKFSTQFLDEDEPQIVYESDYNNIPPLPFNKLPAVGFLTSKANNNHKQIVDDGRSSLISGGITGTSTTNIMMTSSTTSSTTMMTSLAASHRLNRSGSQSPTVGTFLFSNPIVIANPAETSTTTTYLENGPLTTKTTTIATNGPVKLTSEAKWTCTTCFISNPGNETKCMACETPKPGEKNQIGSSAGFTTTKITIAGTATLQTSKWTCTTCFISNPSSETKCMACETPKPGEKNQISSNAGFTTTKISTAGTAVPQISKWTCTTCFISNPSNETNCMACGASKPGEKKLISSFPDFSTTKITAAGVLPQTLNFGFKPQAPVSSVVVTPPVTSLPPPTTSIAPVTTAAPLPPSVVSSNSIAKPTFPLPAATANITSSVFSPPTATTTAPMASVTSALLTTSSAAPAFGSGLSFQFGSPSTTLTTFNSGLTPFQATTQPSNSVSTSSSTGFFSTPSASTAAPAAPAPVFGASFSANTAAVPVPPIVAPSITSLPPPSASIAPVTTTAPVSSNSIAKPTFSLPEATTDITSSIFSQTTPSITAPTATSAFQTTSSAAPAFGSGFSFQFGGPSTTAPSFSSSGLGLFQTPPQPTNSISTSSSSSIFSPPTTSVTAPTATSAFPTTTSAAPAFNSGFSFKFGSLPVTSTTAPSFSSGLGLFQSTPQSSNSISTSSSSSLFPLPTTSATAPTATSAFQPTSSAAPAFGSGFSFQFGSPSTTLSSFSGGLGPFQAAAQPSNSISTSSSTGLFSTPVASAAAPAAPAPVFGASFAATPAAVSGAPFSNVAGPAAPSANIFSINKTSSGSASSSARKTLTAKRKTGRGH